MTPPGDGAWICKNSWGTAWGDEGYFYVSYYDNTLCAFPNETGECFVAFSFENTVPYNNNYQYDFSGLSKFHKDGDEIKYFNEFTAYEDDVIAAVGTYFNAAGVEYTIEIVITDEIVYKQNGVSPYFGYHTIKLDKYVSIKKGENFSVVITSNAVPISETSRVIYAKDCSGVVKGEDAQYLSVDGAVACLKAYTLPNQFTTENIVEYYSDHKVFKVNVNKSGESVSVLVNKTEMTNTSDENGIATFYLPLLNVGVHAIETTYNNTTVINTVKVIHTVKVSNKITVGYNAKLNVKVTILDKRQWARKQKGKNNI